MNKKYGTIVLLFLLGLLLNISFAPTLAASMGDTHVKLVLNPQGGTGGTAEVYVESGQAMPKITPPVRIGYQFMGYYTAASGKGEQYYSGDGEPKRTTCGFTDTAGLYAFWEVRTYSITYHNMENAQYGANAPVSHQYGLNTTISDPVKPGYEFFGWQINNSLIASQGLTIGATDYDMDLELTAVWNKAHLVTVQNNTTTTVTILDSDLQEVFRRQVSNPEYGVTADDLNSDEVKLTMVASDQDEQADGAKEIIGLAQGEVMKFYDFTVNKSVTKQGSFREDTLMQLPNTVRVEITLDEELQGRTAYRVYRYHNQEPEVIPAGPVDDETKTKEFYELSSDGKTIIIYTRRLSTYAVVGSQKILEGFGSIKDGNQDVDVQAQVIEGGNGAVYKLDIVWGPMRFTYSTGNEWDPEKHRYTDVRIYDWIPEECYTKGNNEVKIYNHSNADVLVDFIATPLLKEGADRKLLDGVDMVMNTTNTACGEPAKNVLLKRVPIEGADAESVTGFLRLNGSPTDPEFYKGLVTGTEAGYEDFVKVASIAVTIQYTNSARTPAVR